MIYRIYPSKDTFITNFKRNNVPQTGSNVGAAETLSVFKKAAISGSTGAQATASLARVLMSFDFSALSALTASGDFPTSGMSYFLVMKDCQHDSTLPFSYDMEVQPLTTAWDEGRGIDVDRYFDKGFANWTKSTQGNYWTTPGGDVTGNSIPVHFDTGYEDLEVDVTSFVNSWLTGGLQNNGLMVSVSSTLEANTEYNDYYLKKFFGRTTHFPDRRPYIEVRFDDSKRDDRANFVFDYTGSLFLYNVVKGQLQDVLGTENGNVYVRVYDASGTLAVLTSSHLSTGVYSASFVLPTGSYSGSVFYDAWFSGSRSFMTCSFTPNGSFAECEVRPQTYVVSVKDLRNDYRTEEAVRLDMFVRGDDHNPAVVHTASSDVTGLVLTKAYYRVTNDRSDEDVIPFGTGAVETTRLSYDGNGNYFKLYMSALTPGEVYRITFLVDADGQRRLIDQGFKFRVK